MASNVKAPNFKILHAPLPQDKYWIKATYPMVDLLGITIHETDTNANARGQAAYMQRNDNWTSFHAAVDDKDIVVCLPLDRAGWHAGDGTNGPGNRKTLAIEIENYYGTNNLEAYNKARANGEKLAGYWMYVYGLSKNSLNYYMHKDWSGKHCPRRIIDQGYWETFKANAEKHKQSYMEAVTPPATVTDNIAKFTVGMRVNIKADAGRYANVNKDIPEWVKKQSHTIMAVNEETRSVLLKEIFSWVKMHDIVGYAGANPSIPQTVNFKVGDYVTVRQGAKSYDGANVINEWYTTPKQIGQINGARVVLDINNWVTAFNIKDLVKASTPTPTPTPAPAPAPKPTPAPTPTQIKVGTQVTASGQVFGDSYGGRYGGTTTVTGPVTYHNPSGTKPYHVGKVGWFAAKDVKAVGAAPAPAPTPKTIGQGSRVYVSGQVFGDSYGGNPGVSIKQYGTVTYTNPGAPKPYHIDNLGWVAAKDVK